MREVERLVREATDVAAAPDRAAGAAPRIRAVSFLHRFGSALNRHVHLHVCVTDGVFSRTATDELAEPGVTFLPARPITPGDLDTLTTRVRKRLIRWFRRHPAHCVAAQTAGWSRLTSNRRFASGRRPGWLRPREDRPPAGAGSLRTGGSQADEGQDGFARVKTAPRPRGRAGRAASGVTSQRPADRVGRARPGLLSTATSSRPRPTSCP